MWPIALALALALSPPEYDPDLPYEEQRPKWEWAKPESKRPPRGTAALAFGIIGLTLGPPLIAGGAVLADSIDAPGIGLIPVVFGVGALTLGIVGTVVGKKRRDAYRRWTSTYSPRPTKIQPGKPQLIIGTTILVAGTLTLIPSARLLVWENNPQVTYVGPVGNRVELPFAIFMTAWATTSIFTGLGLIANGSDRRRHALAHARERPTLTPSGWATRDSFGFGVAGRF